MRPAFLLPLCWKPESGHSPNLPSDLHELADQVVASVRQPKWKCQQWGLYVAEGRGLDDCELADDLGRWLDGEPVRSCLMYAVQADGHKVTTVEGLAQPDGSLSVLQDSFCEMHGLQCGYCTPGMLIAAQALLNVNRQPSEEQIRDAIGGNLCRCTGYQQIVEAVKLAAKRLAAGAM